MDEGECLAKTYNTWYPTKCRDPDGVPVYWPGIDESEASMNRCLYDSSAAGGHHVPHSFDSDTDTCSNGDGFLFSPSLTNGVGSWDATAAEDARTYVADCPSEDSCLYIPTGNVWNADFAADEVGVCHDQHGAPVVIDINGAGITSEEACVKYVYGDGTYSSYDIGANTWDPTQGVCTDHAEVPVELGVDGTDNTVTEAECLDFLTGNKWDGTVDENDVAVTGHCTDPTGAIVVADSSDECTGVATGNTWVAKDDLSDTDSGELGIGHLLFDDDVAYKLIGGKEESCEETASTSVQADADACALVDISGDDATADRVACESVKTEADDTVGACTYTAVAEYPGVVHAETGTRTIDFNCAEFMWDKHDCGQPEDGQVPLKTGRSTSPETLLAPGPAACVETTVRGVSVAEDAALCAAVELTGNDELDALACEIGEDAPVTTADPTIKACTYKPLIPLMCDLLTPQPDVDALVNGFVVCPDGGCVRQCVDGAAADDGDNDVTTTDLFTRPPQSVGATTTTVVNVGDNYVWVAQNGKTCEDYEIEKLCTSDGGYGVGWDPTLLGEFADYANNGVDATQACCVCGGGSGGTQVCSQESSTQIEDFAQYADFSAGNGMTLSDWIDEVERFNGVLDTCVYGCMDSTQANYNPEANFDTHPSLCRPYVEGCMDDTMFNYLKCQNSAGNWNGCVCPWGEPCEVDKSAPEMCIPYQWGCTDDDAFNFDPTANTACDDETTPDPNGCDSVDAPDTNACIPRVFGCTVEGFFTYGKELVNGLLVDGVWTGTLQEASAVANTACDHEDAPADCLICDEGGCTDPLATNYDSTAIIENGSCVFPVKVTYPVQMTRPDDVTEEDFLDTARADFARAAGIITADEHSSYTTVGHALYGECTANCIARVKVALSSRRRLSEPAGRRQLQTSVGLIVVIVPDATQVSQASSISTADLSAVSSYTVTAVETPTIDLGGCTDTNAVNFIAAATQDDGTCAMSKDVPEKIDSSSIHFQDISGTNAKMIWNAPKLGAYQLPIMGYKIRVRECGPTDTVILPAGTELPPSEHSGDAVVSAGCTEYVETISRYEDVDGGDCTYDSGSTTIVGLSVAETNTRCAASCART